MYPSSNHQGTTHDPEKRRVIEEKVAAMLSRNAAYLSLSAPQRNDILENTAKVVEAMAASDAGTPTEDPYAFPQDTGSRRKKDKDQPFAAEGIAAGVTQTVRMVKEVDFPDFVQKLISGTFHAIVTSSIEQMHAYAEMVKSVSQTLNQFRDDNVTQNQGIDHLASRYPNVFQMQVVDGQPKLVARDDVDSSSMPNFQNDLGLSESVTDLDEETIQQKLIPAARDDLARSRQQLLATIVVMGINRIIVTDGKINAKVRFQFSASDQMRRQASDYDYQQYGTTVTSQGQYESEYTQSDRKYNADTKGTDYSGGSSYAKGAYQYASVPNVKVTSETHTDTTASLTASGQLMGEVSVNFRSETFPLEKMVDTDAMMRIQGAQRGAGRAAPAPAAGAAAPAPAAPTPAPAPAPAQHTT